MRYFGKKRLFTLAAFLGLFIITLTATQMAQAAFIQNEATYWNMGNQALPGNSKGDINHCTLQSSHLKTPNNTVGFNVYTPPSYNNSGSQHYPVIYLLHGVNGNEYNYFGWFNSSTFFNSNSGSLPSLIDNGLADEAILVFVNGGARSFYDDWKNSTGYGPSSSFPILSETVIMQDVIPFIDANFRTIANRNGRAIEGFSMGGRGALKLAFTYSNQFCSTIAYAGAGYEEVPETAGTDHPRLGLMETEYRMSTIAANNAASIKANNLQIRMADGAGDGTAGQGGGSDDLSVQLTNLGIDHEFVASLNGVMQHRWDQYHRVTGAYGLNFHFQCFAAAKTAVSTTTIQGTGNIFNYLPLVMKPAAVTAGSCN